MFSQNFTIYFTVHARSLASAIRFLCAPVRGIYWCCSVLVFFLFHSLFFFWLLLFLLTFVWERKIERTFLVCRFDRMYCTSCVFTTYNVWMWIFADLYVLSECWEETVIRRQSYNTYVLPLSIYMFSHPYLYIYFFLGVQFFAELLFAKQTFFSSLWLLFVGNDRSYAVPKTGGF